MKWTKPQEPSSSTASFPPRCVIRATTATCRAPYCGDGDPVDVLVILPLPLIPGAAIRCRPVGMLKMTDEAGTDTKILAVPVAKVFGGYSHIGDIGQVSPHWLERIGHFFEHYKDLEKGKWVRIEGWEDAAAAKREIIESQARYADSPEKPKF